ncbi:MAG: DUF2325 domain-containing protein [Nitrospira sp.]
MNAISARDNKRAGAISARDPQAGQRRPNILIVGGDSIGIFRQRKARGRGSIEHFSGRKRRDLTRPIPRDTEAVVVVLDRVSHALARKIRIEAGRRGLPVVYQKRAHVGAVNGNSDDFVQLRAVKER